MKKVVALGEILIDFAQKSTDDAGYPALQAQPGGAPANFLAAAAKYGTGAAMIGKVGNDAFGNMLINTLKENGIDTTGVKKDDSVFTTLAFVTLDENGDRSFSFARKPGADTRLSFGEIELSLIDDADVFHFGTLSLTDDPARSATIKCLEYAKSKGKLISYDPNLRLSLWDSEDKARTAMFMGFEYADVVKISDEEVEFLWDCTPQAGAQIILNKYNTSLVYVTMGEKGCYFATRKAKGLVPNPNGIQPVDTTGAGDIFGGSAMHKLLQTGAHPSQLTEKQLTEICRFATCAAALSTQRPGGINSVPDISEVEKIL